jgi:hypothetical protein
MLKSKVLGMLAGASLLIGVLWFVECQHERLYHGDELQAAPRQEHCELVADTIVEYIHARRGLGCSTIMDRENTANSIAETQVLTCIYTNMQCNYRYLMERIEKHIEECTRCQSYVKCGE